jgi:hypothetical protein
MAKRKVFLPLNPNSSENAHLGIELPFPQIDVAILNNTVCLANGTTAHFGTRDL